MASVLRVRGATGAGDHPAGPAKQYLNRLVQLIPAEVVGLYLAGRSAIEDHFSNQPQSHTEPWFWIGWALVCLVAVVLVRAWATSDRPAGRPPEWIAVAIATVSFAIWVYSLGDITRALKLDSANALIAILLVLFWTFVVPIIYRGDTHQ